MGAKIETVHGIQVQKKLDWKNGKKLKSSVTDGSTK